MRRNKCFELSIATISFSVFVAFANVVLNPRLLDPAYMKEGRKQTIQSMGQEYDLEQKRKYRAKPKFYIHVGPHKTGTTFLQCSLCAPGRHISDENLDDLVESPDDQNATSDEEEKSELLAVKNILSLDNFVFIGTCPCNRRDDDYLIHSKDAIFSPAKSNHFAEGFIARVKEAYNSGKNVLLIHERCSIFSRSQMSTLLNYLWTMDKTLSETLSDHDHDDDDGIESTDRAIDPDDSEDGAESTDRALFKDDINNGWDVHIVVAYRRLLEWFPSVYNQKLKPKRASRKSNLWPGEGGFELEPFGLDAKRIANSTVRPIETSGQHVAEKVYDRYRRRLKVPANIHVINIHELNSEASVIPPLSDFHNGTHSKINGRDRDDIHGDDLGDPYMIHLLCNVIQNASNACSSSKMGTIGHKETVNPSVSLNYEMIASAARQQELIGKEVTKSKAMISAEIKHQQEVVLGKSIMDFPLVCPSSTLLDRMFNLSLDTEVRFFDTLWQQQSLDTNFDSKEEWKWLKNWKLHRQRRGSEDQHRVSLDNLIEREKMCSVNATAVLEMPEWRTFFRWV